MPETGSPPGAMRNKPQTPRAGRLGFWRTCGITDFGKPRCREAPGPAGPSAFVCATCASLSAPGTFGVPRALGSFSGAAEVLRAGYRASPASDWTTASPAPPRTGAMTLALARTGQARHARRWLDRCVIMRGQDIRLSSSAKADDPVSTDSAVITGCPAFAGHDSGEGGANGAGMSGEGSPRANLG